MLRETISQGYPLATLRGNASHGVSGECRLAVHKEIKRVQVSAQGVGDNLNG